MRFNFLTDPEARRIFFVFGSWRDPGLRRRVAYLTAGFAVLVLFALAISGLPFEGNSVYCGKTCHQVNPQFQSWKRSAHKDVACFLCHSDGAGLPGRRELTTKIKHLSKALGGGLSGPINADSSYSQRYVPNSRCIGCHQTGRTGGGKGLSVYNKIHTAHLQANMTCTICHNRVAHKGAEDRVPLKNSRPDFRYKDFMTMRQGCWRCHGQEAKDRDPETLAVVGGRPAPSACLTCHNRDWNLTPESGPYDHTPKSGPAWEEGRRHGRAALKDFSACFACHRRDLAQAGPGMAPDCAQSCHKGVSMPHRTRKWRRFFPLSDRKLNWLARHGDVAQAAGVSFSADARSLDRQGVCVGCHDDNQPQANFCQSCHHQRFEQASGRDIPWQGRHQLVARDQGSSGCQDCHSLEYCADCHLAGRKSVSGAKLTLAR